jgi:hypothetical protein
MPVLKDLYHPLGRIYSSSKTRTLARLQRESCQITSATGISGAYQACMALNAALKMHANDFEVRRQMVTVLDTVAAFRARRR